jgi:hypothetical protein
MDLWRDLCIELKWAEDGLKHAKQVVQTIPNTDYGRHEAARIPTLEGMIESIKQAQKVKDPDEP